MSSSVHQELLPLFQISLHNATDSDLEQLLCNAEWTGKLFPFLDELGDDPLDLRESLCGSNLNVTLEQFRSGLNMGKVLLEVRHLCVQATEASCSPEVWLNSPCSSPSKNICPLFLQILESEPRFSLNTDWLEMISDDVKRLTESMDELLEMSSLGEGLDASNIEEVLPTLQRFVKDEGPEIVFEKWALLASVSGPHTIDGDSECSVACKVADVMVFDSLFSIHQLINDLRLVFDDDTSKEVFDDLEILADGIKGLEILRKYLGLNGEVALQNRNLPAQLHGRCHCRTCNIIIWLSFFKFWSQTWSGLQGTCTTLW